MSKLVKKMEYAALEKTFHGVRDLVLLGPGKVDSALDASFRKTLREKKIRVLMVKNTLVRKIFEAQGIKLDGVWAGPTLVCWGPESIKDLAVAVDDMLKEVVKKDPKTGAEKFKVKTAVADGQPVALDVAKKIPTRLEAVGEIVAALMGPASEIAGCLVGPAAELASQIASIADKKEDAVPAAPAA